MQAESVALWLPADAVLVAVVAVAGFALFGDLYMMLARDLRWLSARSKLFRFLHLAPVGVMVVQAWRGLVCSSRSRAESRL